jgi:hypothetical protein
LYKLWELRKLRRGLFELRIWIWQLRFEWYRLFELRQLFELFELYLQQLL